MNNMFRSLFLAISTFSALLPCLGQDGIGGRGNAPVTIEFENTVLNWMPGEELSRPRFKTGTADSLCRNLNWSSSAPEIIWVDPASGDLIPRIPGHGRIVVISASGHNSRGSYVIRILSEFPELDRSILDYMDQADVKGMSVAVIYRERLVYRRAYGFANDSTLANVNHMFRIASMSKPVTVIGLLKLVEDGKLDLDHKVFGQGGILGEDFGPVPLDSHKDEITVRHLIEHTAGWAGDMAYTGYNDYSDAGELVRAGLASYDLYFRPGERYFYSNFGYGVLGRVIEKVSGQSYYNYVQENILNSCGIERMKPAKGPVADRDPEEVQYYSDNEQADMIHPAISNYFDSFGGWIATPTEYAKFMVRTDRSGHVPDILPEDILNQTYFKGNWQHGGMLPGTSTNVVRLTDDLTMIYMANTWRFFNPLFGQMNNSVREPIMARTEWPDYDLFDE